LLVICGSLQLYADYTLPGLQYEREAVLAGQVWRLLTGNLVHLGWIHFLLNIGTLLIFWLLYGRDLSTRSLVRIYVLSCMGTCSGLLLFNRMIIWYAGLSGCLYGLLIYGGLRTFRI
jgi:rhomboid family GlyGly-CTERM serine protease